MYVYLKICTYTYAHIIYVYTGHVFTHMRTHIFNCSHTHTYIHTYIHAYIHTYIYIYMFYVHTERCTHTDISACIYAYVRKCRFMHTCVDIYRAWYLHVCLVTFVHMRASTYTCIHMCCACRFFSLCVCTQLSVCLSVYQSLRLGSDGVTCRLLCPSTV